MLMDTGLSCFWLWPFLLTSPARCSPPGYPGFFSVLTAGPTSLGHCCSQVWQTDALKIQQRICSQLRDRKSEMSASAGLSPALALRNLCARVSLCLFTRATTQHHVTTLIVAAQFLWCCQFATFTTARCMPLGGGT